MANFLTITSTTVTTGTTIDGWALARNGSATFDTNTTTSETCAGGPSGAPTGGPPDGAAGRAARGAAGRPARGAAGRAAGGPARGAAGGPAGTRLTGDRVGV
ncbi:hypothetical protein VM98_37200, partial [Streptomyces rubellomurinus subsp. indigoferus]